MAIIDREILCDYNPCPQQAGNFCDVCTERERERAPYCETCAHSQLDHSFRSSSCLFLTRQGRCECWQFVGAEVPE